MATANDVTQLPPELLRKGRFDGLFFVDLPNQVEREAIWRIQIAKYGRTPDKFDIAELARATEGLTGSEIEQLFIDGLYDGFSRPLRYVTGNDEPPCFVASSAREQCREHLRMRRDFALNATKVTRQMRQRWIDLFPDYSARIELVY